MSEPGFALSMLGALGIFVAGYFKSDRMLWAALAAMVAGMVWLVIDAWIKAAPTC